MRQRLKEEQRCNSSEQPQMSDTAIDADTLNVPKNGRFKFSFSRSSTKNKHLSSSPCPSSSSTTSLSSSQHFSMRKSTDSPIRVDFTSGQQETQLARLQQNSNLTQNRYIILPSDKSSQRNHQSSPSSSVPLIDLLTDDDPTFDLPEETHILLPSPISPCSSTPARNSVATCAPPRPITRHPGSTGDFNSISSSSSIKGAADTSRCTNSNSGLSGTSKNSINSDDSLSKNSSGLPQREGENRNNNNNNNNTNGNGLVNKPPKGWLHPEQLITSTGVNYSVKYIGCLQINTSMRSLDFDTRSSLAKECISRVCKATGLPVQEANRKVDHRILKMLADQVNLTHTGKQVNLNITSASLNLTVINSGEVIAQHEMPNISFASNGDIDLMDFVSYVAKDTKHGRACFVLHCEGDSAQDVINTIGQAFELRFKEFLRRTPRLESSTISNNSGALATSASRSFSSSSQVDACHVEADREYYNDLPGKVPPEIESATTASTVCSISSCNLINGASTGLHPSSSPYTATPSSATGKVDEFPGASNAPITSKQIDRKERSNLIDLGYDASECEYVNHQPTCLSTSRKLDDELLKDPFDMKPFNCTLQELSRQRLLGNEANGSSDFPPWFCGTISRKESETLVINDGDFLVRESVNCPGQFILTGKQDGMCQHLLLVDRNGVVRTKNSSFKSVLHLINHHRDHNLPIVSAESILHLSKPVNTGIITF